ncbi:ABC transporter permease [Bacillus sp. FSL M7-0558]|uniref:ABC transporter permease n=1 Tax=Bacillus sp. FSL M7-0558 TaxID=2921533 RepID=UPI0030FC5CAE
MKWNYIAKKDIKILLKDPSALVVLLILPLMFMTIMSFALKNEYGSNDNPVTLGYFDKDNSVLSREYLAKIKESEGIKLEKISVAEDFANYKKENKYIVLFTIPEGFEKSIVDNNRVNIEMFSDATQATTANVVIQSIIGVSRAFEVKYQLKNYGIKQADMTNKFVNNAISETIKDIENELGMELSINNSKNEDKEESISKDTEKLMKEEVEKQNISVKNVFSNDQKTSPNSFQQNVPGYAVMFAFFIVMWSGKSFLKERESGTWKRLLISKANSFDLYFGKFIPNYVVNFFQILLLFIFGNLAFKMSLGKDMLALILMIAVLSLCSTSLGALLSLVAKTDSQLTGYSLFIVLFSAALGGTMVPLRLMPEMMQKIAQVVPQSWALEGFQKIIVSNGNISSISINLTVLLGFSLVFLMSSLILIRTNK